MAIKEVKEAYVQCGTLHAIVEDGVIIKMDSIVLNGHVTKEQVTTYIRFCNEVLEAVDRTKGD